MWTVRSTPCATRASSTRSCSSKTSKPSKTASPKTQKQATSGGDKNARRAVELLLQYKAALEQGRTAPARWNWTKEDRKLVADLNLLTDKPVLYVCNVDEKSAVTGNADTEAVQRGHRGRERPKCSSIAAATEADIAELEELRGAADVPRRHSALRSRAWLA